MTEIESRESAEPAAAGAAPDGLVGDRDPTVPVPVQGDGTEGGPAVGVAWPTGGGRWGRLAVGVVALLALAGVGSWQAVSLHDQVTTLQRNDRAARQLIARQQRQLTDLHNAVSAAVSCLETTQSQQGICTQFFR